MVTPLDLEKQLKKIKLKPLTGEESNLLWSKIEQKINWERPAVYGHAFSITNMFKQKFAISVLSVAIIVGSSFATATLADNAKPGDILFPVDLAVEKIRITLSSNTQKDELKIKFSEERIAETEIILKRSGASALANLTSTASISSDVQASGTKEVEQTEKALNTAIDYLRKTRAELSQSGNQTAVATLDTAINKLTGLAQNHIAGLEKIETKIKGNDDKLKIEIKASNNELKTKFKIETKNRGKDNDDNDKIKIKIKTSSKSHDDKDRDADEEDDEDDDDDKIISICHIPSGNPNGKQTIRIGRKAQKAHLAHGDTLGPCPNLSPSPSPSPSLTPTPSPTLTPDTAAPVISNVVISGLAANSTNINWSTNEQATSKVWFGFSSPFVITATTSFVESSLLVSSHLINLNGLTASKTYQYIISSTDGVGNTSNSSPFSFTTLP